MKLFITYLIVLFACTNKHFEVIKAQFENWTAGIPSGGNGTEYYFNTIIKTDQAITFDSLWVNGKVLKLIAVKGNLYNPKSIINKNDTIILRATYTSKDFKTSKPPVKCKGMALFSYYINNQRYFFTLKKLEQKQGLAHP